MQYWIQHTINWLIAIAFLSLIGSFVPFTDLCVKYGEARKKGINLPDGAEGGLPLDVIVEDIIPNANGARRAFLFLIRIFLVSIFFWVVLAWARDNLSFQ